MLKFREFYVAEISFFKNNDVSLYIIEGVSETSFKVISIENQNVFKIDKVNSFKIINRISLTDEKLYSKKQEEIVKKIKNFSSQKLEMLNNIIDNLLIQDSSSTSTEKNVNDYNQEKI